MIQWWVVCSEPELRGGPTVTLGHGQSVLRREREIVRREKRIGEKSGASGARRSDATRKGNKSMMLRISPE